MIISDHKLLYTTYVDNTNFSLNDITSTKNDLKDPNSSFEFSRLWRNITKCEIEAIGVIKSGTVTLYSRKS